jgi:cyclopropane fatty-acyl-phospholipid synthase-like methyltransferase
LQDFWAIGTSSEEIIKIIKKFKTGYSNLNVLDLGSGKGAVSVKIAAELKCKCFGIDAIDDFVVFSNNKAEEFSVNNICTFETGDIRTRINTLGKYDIIILGAIGAIFGNYYDTLSKLKAHLNKDGIIIIDDAYIEDDCNEDCPNVLKKCELMKQIDDARMELIYKITGNEIYGINDEYCNQFENLQKRCMELAEKYPEDKELFLAYIEKQKDEYGKMSNEITPVILVITTKASTY